MGQIVMDEHDWPNIYHYIWNAGAWIYASQASENTTEKQKRDGVKCIEKNNGEDDKLVSQKDGLLQNMVYMTGWIDRWRVSWEEMNEGLNK